MQCFKVGHTIGIEPDNFSVKNGRALNPRHVLDDQRVALRPIRAIHCVEAHPAITNVDLQPIAIVLQLMRPARPRGWLGGDARLTGMNEGSRRVERPASGTTHTLQHTDRYKCLTRKIEGLPCCATAAPPNGDHWRGVRGTDASDPTQERENRVKVSGNLRDISDFSGDRTWPMMPPLPTVATVGPRCPPTPDRAARLFLFTNGCVCRN